MNVRLLAIPGSHPYVRAVARDVELLPDPPVPGAPPGQWWPPQALRPDWIERHAEDFDVVHVHFGTEGSSLAELAAFVEAVRRAGRPLVVTAHDLEHPHLTDPAGHDEHLALLVRSADAVLTLTPGAAAVLRSRHGIAPVVVTHPRVAEEPWFARSDEWRHRRASPTPRVGVHLRAMRANVGTGDWLGPLSAACRAAGASLQLFVNDEITGGAAWPALRRSLRATAADLHVRPRPDDDALAAELATLDVSVLPYAHGTHSGWLELCWDLGTRVLAPRVGFFAQQHPDPWFFASFDQGVADGAARALPGLLAGGPVPPAAQRLARRTAELDEVAATHRALYVRLAGGVGRAATRVPGHVA